MKINTTNDFREETKGYDPDGYRRVLQDYHKSLWEKKLPNGDFFSLEKQGTLGTLKFSYHSSEEKFVLSSDRMIPPFIKPEDDYSTNHKKLHFVNQLPLEQRQSFYRFSNTIGNRILFPCNRVAGAMTINQRRGTLHPIADRFDLTLECIRRFYLGEESPLYSTMENYENFFELFIDFQGYVDFFLLNNLVDEGTGTIKFFLPFKSFENSPLPQNLEEYLSYQESAEKFILQRNDRINQINIKNE